MKKLLFCILTLASCPSILSMEQPEKSLNEHIAQFNQYCENKKFDEAAQFYSQNLCNEENLAESKGYGALILQTEKLIENQNGQALSSLICFVDDTDSLHQLANQVINNNLAKNQTLGIIPELKKQPGFMTLAEQDKEVDTALGKYIYEESLKNLASLLVLQKKYKENPTQSPKIKEALKKLPLFSICLLDDNDAQIDLSPEQFCALCTASKTIQELIADQHVDFKATKYELSLLNITHEQFSLLCPLLDIIVNKKFLCDQSIESLFLRHLKTFEFEKLLVLYGLAEYLDIESLQRTCSQLVTNIVLQKDELIKFVKNPTKFLEEFKFLSLRELITEKIVQAKKSDLIKNTDFSSPLISYDLESLHFLSFSPGNTLFAIGCDNGNRINFYKMEKNNVEQSRFFSENCAACAYCVVFSSDDKFIATLRNEMLTIYELSPDAKKPKKIFSIKERYILTAAFSPDNSVIAIGRWKDRKHCVEIYSIGEGGTFSLKCTLYDHTNFLEGVTFSPDGKFFASWSEDKTLILYSVAADNTFKKLKTFKNETSFCDVSFRPDSTWLVSNVGPYYYDCSTMEGEDLIHMNVQEALGADQEFFSLYFYSNDLVIVKAYNSDEEVSLHLLSIDGNGFKLIKTINQELNYAKRLAFDKSGKFIAYNIPRYDDYKDAINLFKISELKSLEQALLFAALLEDLSIDLTNEELEKIFDSLEEPLKKLKKD